MVKTGSITSEMK